MYRFDSKEHVHLLEGSPLYGTSTVIKEVMPPFLAKWGAQCAVDYIDTQLVEPHRQALKDEGDELQSVEWFVDDIKEVFKGAVNAWSKVRKDAATKGTDLHSELEHYVTVCLQQTKGAPIKLNPEEYSLALSSFSKWAVFNVDRFIFAEKNTYSKELWVGGVVDCVAKLKDGRFAVIDFKSSREAYFNQFAQAAGYALQLDESGYGDADGSNWQKLEDKILALIVVPFGGTTLKPEIIENVEGYKEVFKSLVNVYGYLNSFNKK